MDLHAADSALGLLESYLCKQYILPIPHQLWHHGFAMFV